MLPHECKSSTFALLVQTRDDAPYLVGTSSVIQYHRLRWVSLAKQILAQDSAALSAGASV